MSHIFIVCGVSASGKSTIGRLLAAELNSVFLEGDDYHSAHNIEKMTSNTPLTDSDRVDWVHAIVQHVNALAAPKIVLSCSALTPFVQTELTTQCTPQITWIKLELSLETALERSKARNHFMPPELIASQFAAWTPPSGGISVDAGLPTHIIIDNITKAIKTE